MHEAEGLAADNLQLIVLASKTDRSDVCLCSVLSHYLEIVTTQIAFDQEATFAAEVNFLTILADEATVDLLEGHVEHLVWELR